VQDGENAEEETFPDPEPVRILSPDFLEPEEFRAIFEAKCVDCKMRFSKKLLKRFQKFQNRKGYRKTFEMNDCGIGPEACAVIAEIISTSNRFRVISLANNRIGNKGGMYISEILHMNPSVISMDVSSNEIGDEGSTAIFSMLRANTSLYHLNMSSSSGVGRNSIGLAGVTELAAMLTENQTLSELNLSMTELIADNMEVLASGLSRNTTLNSLNISQNNIGSRGAIHIIRSLCNTQIHELYLSNIHLKDDVTNIFRALLARNKTLRILDLSSNHLTSRFCAELALPLSSDAQIAVLNLSRNPIGTGITSLGPALKNNTLLKVLDVSYCQIEAGAFVEFCNGMRLNKGLEEMHMSHNPLLDEGVICFGSVLRVHPSLQVIDLEGTEICDPGGEAVFSAALESKSIRKINIKNNLVRNGVIIHQAVVGNPRIRYCNVELNDLDYRVTVVIHKAVASNVKAWREGRELRVADKVDSLAEEEDRLMVVRESVRNLRLLVASMQARIAEMNEELEKARNSKNSRLSAMEARLDALIQEASRESDDMQAKLDVLRSGLTLKESTVASMSNRLSREGDALSKDLKMLAILEQRIVQAKQGFRPELYDLNDNLNGAKHRYELRKQQLIEKWEMIRRARKAEAEAARKNKKEAPAPAGMSGDSPGSVKRKSTSPNAKKAPKLAKKARVGAKKGPNAAGGAAAGKTVKPSPKKPSASPKKR
jgi:Ran GTPase-activating protein (RanGAP) involved in mRNA processing and transport